MDLKNMDIKELFDLLEPALETKEIQLRRSDYLNISKTDIWSFLVGTKWRGVPDLRVYQMTSDILNADSEEILRFKKSR